MIPINLSLIKYIDYKPILVNWVSQFNAGKRIDCWVFFKDKDTTVNSIKIDFDFLEVTDTEIKFKIPSYVLQPTPTRSIKEVKIITESVLFAAPLFELDINSEDKNWSPADVVEIKGIGLFPVSKGQWREDQIESLFKP